MNKLKICNQEIQYIESDEALEIVLSDRLDLFDVQKVTIYVRKDTSLEIEYENSENKMDIKIMIDSDVWLDIFELKEETKSKAQYQYILGNNSHLVVKKFYDNKEVKELDIIHINGEQSTVSYTLKTIATGSQKYDIVVYHNAKNTTSNIVNHGVNIKEGSLDFHVTSVVYEGLTGCNVNQDNRIITYNEKKCSIDPILLIEENDVVANHSAYVGKFKEEAMFYLMSRGINENLATQLLLKGFLLQEMPELEKLQTIIQKYWR